MQEIIRSSRHERVKEAVMHAVEAGSMREFPANERQVLLFRYLLDMTIPDIARRMGWADRDEAYNAMRRGLTKLGVE